MDKLKFWGAAVAFILFLWVLSPSKDEVVEEGLIKEANLIDDGTQVVNATENELAKPQPVKFQTGEVPLTTANGTLPLTLGFAVEPEKQEMGLMYARTWPSYMHGLLFLFQKEDTYSMWMRNTYLPLDIVFIDRDGYIQQIERNTTPLSETPIVAKQPVLAILEIKAGSADAWNIKIGDRFRLKYFRSALPAS